MSGRRQNAQMCTSGGRGHQNCSCTTRNVHGKYAELAAINFQPEWTQGPGPRPVINFPGSRRSSRRPLDAAQTVYFTIYYSLSRVSEELPETASSKFQESGPNATLKPKVCSPLCSSSVRGSVRGSLPIYISKVAPAGQKSCIAKNSLGSRAGVISMCSIAL